MLADGPGSQRSDVQPSPAKGRGEEAGQAAPGFQAPGFCAEKAGGLWQETTPGTPAGRCRCRLLKVQIQGQRVLALPKPTWHLIDEKMPSKTLPVFLV